MSKFHKLGVVGSPIEHSLSPFIHSRFARNEKINLEYLPYKIESDEFVVFIRDFFKDKDSKGLNITLPYKQNASLLEGEKPLEINFINSANTIHKINNKLYIHSTDGMGFIEDFNKKKLILSNKNILIYGAGGAVESILFQIINEKPKSITIINRTPSKVTKISKNYKKLFKISKINDIDENTKFDVILNGTSVTNNDMGYMQNISFNKGAVFYDLNYSLDETPFCKWAKSFSDNIHDGIGMLVYQAAYSFEIWFNVMPETKLILNEINEMKK